MKIEDYSLVPTKWIEDKLEQLKKDFEVLEGPIAFTDEKSIQELKTVSGSLLGQFYLLSALKEQLKPAIELSNDSFDAGYNRGFDSCSSAEFGAFPSTTTKEDFFNHYDK